MSLFTLFTIPIVSKGLRASLPFPNELRPVKAYPEFPRLCFLGLSYGFCRNTRRWAIDRSGYEPRGCFLSIVGHSLGDR